MTTTTRAAFAACLFAAFVAGTHAPGFASAHAVQPANDANTHPPAPPTNVRVELHGEPDVAADGTKTYRAVRVSWRESHAHFGRTMGTYHLFHYVGTTKVPGLAPGPNQQSIGRQIRRVSASGAVRDISDG